VFTSLEASAPGASEPTAGIAEIATQAETDAGTDNLRIVTPLKPATYAGRVRKLSTSALGDGSATQLDITHNWNTRLAFVQVQLAASPWAKVGCDISFPDANTVRLNFAAGPTSNEPIAVVVG
jgi:hypothetical protein